MRLYMYEVLHTSNIQLKLLPRLVWSVTMLSTFYKLHCQHDLANMEKDTSTRLTNRNQKNWDIQLVLNWLRTKLYCKCEADSNTKQNLGLSWSNNQPYSAYCSSFKFYQWIQTFTTLTSCRPVLKQVLFISGDSLLFSCKRDTKLVQLLTRCCKMAINLLLMSSTAFYPEDNIITKRTFYPYLSDNKCSDIEGLNYIRGLWK